MIENYELRPLNFIEFEPKIKSNKKFINNVTQSDYSAGIYGHYWTFDFVKVISDFIDFEDIKIIFDVGSRDCLQSQEFYKFFPQSHIWAFEGNPNLFPICELNSQNYPITFVPKALTNYNGTTIFNVVDDENVGASSLLKTTDIGRSSEWKQREVTVDCVRLDTFMEDNNIPHIDLLWVDVQGAEKIVFDGLGDKLKNVKAINTEIGLQPLYHNSTEAEEFNNYMIENVFINLKSYYMDSVFDRNDEMEIIYLNKKYLKK